MRITSALVCRASEKVYEQLDVEGLPQGHTLVADPLPAPDGVPLPCWLFELDEPAAKAATPAPTAAPAPARSLVLVVPDLREGTLEVPLAELDPDGQVVAREAHVVDLARAKWASRLNYRLHAQACARIRLIDERDGLSPTCADGSGSLEVTRAIGAPADVILRGTVRLPFAEGRRVRIAAVAAGGRVVARDHVLMGASRAPMARVPGAFWYELRFSMRVPWGTGELALVAWDEALGGRAVTAHLPAAELDALVAASERLMFQNAGVDPYYPEWFRKQRVTPHELALQRAHPPEGAPSFSLVVPLWHTPPEHFRAMVDSVRAQSFGRWQLVLVNASPEDAELARLVADVAAADARVSVVALEGNRGIALNTNAGIAEATGDFVGFLDHDDTIEPDLLFEYARAVAEEPTCDLIYCDEDKIAPDGTPCAPFFKDDFNIDELRSLNYVCHLLCVRRSLLAELEPSGPELDGAQDHDLTLKASERARHVAHVRRVLYHWRVTEGSTSAEGDAKPYASEAGLRAVRAHLARLGIPAEVTPGEYAYSYSVRYLPPEGGPLVSVIIPTCDHADVLRRCVESVCERSTYPNLEVLLVENNSSDPTTFACYDELCQAHPGRVRVATWTGEFNFSKIVNFGAAQALGDYLLLLNNDTEVVTPDWVERLLGTAARDDVGAVGCRLWYPDDTVQHVGVVLTYRDAGHLLRDLPRENRGYFHLECHQRALSAVTAACMMVSRRAFELVGGFDEDFAVAYNDVDFCLRLGRAGLLVVYVPEVELYHYESLSRGFDTDIRGRGRFFREEALMLGRWSDFFAEGDPHYPRVLRQTIPESWYYRF